MELGVLSEIHESKGDPAIVSGGIDDPGGMSYGAYQLSSELGSVDEFLGWGLRQEGFYKDYARALQQAGPINSVGFIRKWQELGTIDSVGFKRMQHDYIKHAYYDVADSILKGYVFDLSVHSLALQNAIWSTAVQHGPKGAVSILIDAMEYVPGYTDKWALSWVNHIRFDWDLLNGVYETRKKRILEDDYLPENTKFNIVHNRYPVEKQQALDMFEAEKRERGL